MELMTKDEWAYLEDIVADAEDRNMEDPTIPEDVLEGMWVKLEQLRPDDGGSD